MSNDPNRILVAISEKLSRLILLSAAQLTARKDLDQRTKVLILSKGGFTSEEIGELLNIRAESVRRLRSKARQA